MAITDPKKALLKIRVSEEEFVISESGAALSATLKGMLGDGAAVDVINLDNIVRSSTVPMIITYLETHADEGLSDEAKANFDLEFGSGKDFDFLKKLVIDAYRLKIGGLTTILGKKMADILATKSGRWVRRALFGPDADPTPEEEEEWKREFSWYDWDAADERERRLQEQEDLEQEEQERLCRRELLNPLIQENIRRVRLYDRVLGFMESPNETVQQAEDRQAVKLPFVFAVDDLLDDNGGDMHETYAMTRRQLERDRDEINRRPLI